MLVDGSDPSGDFVDHAFHLQDTVHTHPHLHRTKLTVDSSILP